jgi:hypothetical protein
MTKRNNPPQHSPFPVGRLSMPVSSAPEERRNFPYAHSRRHCRSSRLERVTHRCKPRRNWLLGRTIAEYLQVGYSLAWNMGALHWRRPA